MKISDLNVGSLEKRAKLDVPALGKALKNMVIGGAAVGVPGTAWYMSQAPSDPQALDHETGKPQVTNFDKWRGQVALQDALKRVRENPDVKVDSGLHRVRIPKSRLKEGILRYLDFEPTKIAVPERGQDRMTTYRQYDTNAHLHSHGDNWLVHQDKYPALNMAIKNPKNKGKMRKAIESGLRHVGLEGISGYIDWLGNVFEGGPTLEERIDAMKDPGKNPKVVAWLKKEERRNLEKRMRKQGSAYEELLVKVGNATLTVEVADDDDKRRTGLSGREKIAEDRGMLFSPAGSYWMRGCKFDLDVLFIDKEAQVIDIQTMRCADPHKIYSSRAAGEPVLAVEAPAGWCERNGVKIGDEIL